MGIYDREYYRGESGMPSWFSGVAPWCKTLIVINCVVFLLQTALHEQQLFVRDWLAASPENIFYKGRIWQLWTATFLHANLWHLVGNMWFFWIVGREIESLYGSRDFLAFYLAAAGLSTLGWAAFDFMSAQNPSDFHYMLGASGAVMAVATVYTLLYPHQRFLLFVIPVPMWALFSLYLAWPIIQNDRQVAIASHLAGLAVGFCFKQFDLRWSRFFSGRFRKPRLRIFSPPVQVEQSRSRPVSPARTFDEGHGPRLSPSISVITEEQLDERLDEILAKIAREGRSALSDEEHRILQEASRRARDKRSDRL